MKIYVIAGNTQEFLHYRAEKFTSLKDTVDDISINDFVNVSSCNVLRGVTDPHGVFIGTWRNRLDITEVLNTLSLYQHAPNAALDKIRSEFIPPIKPTPKVVYTNPPPYDKGIDAAAEAFAKAIDEEVVKQLINSPTIRPSQNAIQALLGASKTVYDNETSTMPFNRWFNSWSDSIK
jgi:hypothetical protein